MPKSETAYGGRVGRFLEDSPAEAHERDPWEDRPLHAYHLEPVSVALLDHVNVTKEPGAYSALVKRAEVARWVMESLADSVIDVAARSALDLARRLRRRPITGIINDQVQEFQSAEAKFEAMAKIWRRFNRGKSIINYAHYAYFQAVAMSWTAVPFMLREVAKGDGTWYVALQYIAGEMPESPEMRGDPVAVRNAWLEWGRRNGYTVQPGEASGND